MKRALPVVALVALAACSDDAAPRPAEAPGTATPDSTASAPPPPTPFTPDDGAVFTFQMNDGGDGILFEPLWVAGNGMLGHPPSDLESEAALEFIPRYLARGTRYALTSGGVEVGAFVVDSAHMTSCVGIGGEGTVQGTIPDSVRTGIAYARVPTQRAWLVAPTGQEDSTARARVLAHLHEDGVPDDELAELVWAPVRVVDAPTGRIVIVSAEVYAFDDAEMPAHAFVAWEQASGREVSASHGDGRSMDAGRAELFDATDLDGDGTPEIVLRHNFYESTQFAILRRTPAGAWQEVYTGGGGGC